MTTRFLEPVEGVQWRWPVLVRCPRCGSRAVVTDESGAPIRMTCPACSLVRQWNGKTRLAVGEGGAVVELTRGHASGAWLDPETGRGWGHELQWPSGRDAFFGAELWLQSECCGGRLLWARNAAHLDYLRAFVAGELRERAVPEARKLGVRGRSPAGESKPLSSKLPTWMKEAKHREEVLRHLDRLRQALD